VKSRGSIWKGILYGGAAGGGAGLALGTVIAVTSNTEDCCPVLWIPYFGIVGLAAGALAGGPLGFAVPKWKRLFDAELGVATDAGFVVPTTRRGFVTSASARLGYGGSTDTAAPGGSLGFHLGLYSRIGRVLAVGSEAGYHNLGAGEKLIRGTVNARFSTPTRPFRAYSVAGIGIYVWRFEESRYAEDPSWGYEPEWKTFAGFNTGLGGSYDVRRLPIAISAEIRFHSDFKDVWRGRRLGLLTATVGGDLGF
jgi:hypothetical protein